MYKCEIICDSLSPQGDRLTTFLVTYPRIIHAEMCRHRMMSRNTASSRAIPFTKMVKDVEESPFIPISWQKHHSGMQGNEYCEDIEGLTIEWLQARNKAVFQATTLHDAGVTKQLCNRLLEPFVWTTELITTSKEGLMNFFELRCPQYLYDYEDEAIYFKSKKDWVNYYNESQNYKERNKKFINVDYLTDLEWLQINESQAEIHIQQIAEMMWDCYNESTPKKLQAGEWHIPFGDNFDGFKLIDMANKIITKNKSEYSPNKDELQIAVTKLGLEVATARCARLSYQTLGDNPKIDYEADIKLHDRLLESKHLSCFEHCARAMSDEEYSSFHKGKLKTIDEGDGVLYQNENLTDGWCNNYKGFIQYRYLVEDK